MLKQFRVPKYSISNTMFDVYNDKEYLKKYDPLSPYCLRTPANLNPKCTNCGNCDNKEVKRINLTRKVSTTSLEDLYDFKVPATNYLLRIVYKIPLELRFQKKVVLDTFIAGRILDNNPDILEKALGINPISEVGLKDKNNIYSGLHAFDLKFTEEVNIRLPDLNSFNIQIIESKLCSSEVLNDKVITIYDYSTSITLLNKITSRIENFKGNPIYSKYVDSRDGLKVSKIHYKYANSIKLIKKDQIHLIFPMDTGEHPLELLHSMLKKKESDLIVNGNLNRIGLFLVDDNPVVCTKHKLLLLKDIFNNPTGKCINCVLGV